MKSPFKIVELLPNTFSASTSAGELDLDVDLSERYAQYRRAVDASQSSSRTSDFAAKLGQSASKISSKI